MRNLALRIVICASLLGASLGAHAQDICALAAGGTSAIGSCEAPTGGVGASKRTDKRLYMGLVWALGKSQFTSPDLQFGFRSINVNSNDNVNGFDISVRFNNSNKLELDSTRLSYLDGKRTTIGNYGFGYSYTAQSALLTGSIQTSHLRLGTDYLINNNNFAPYFEVNTLTKIKKVTPQQACGTGSLHTVDYNTPSPPALGDPDGLYAPIGGLPVGTVTCFNSTPM